MMNAGLAIVLAAALGQAPVASPPPSTGVPECDRYVAMVRACLPKMCEEERALRELELEFALETIAAVVKHKGAAAAEKTCSADIAAEGGDDLYGCHGGPVASSILVEARISTGSGNRPSRRLTTAVTVKGSTIHGTSRTWCVPASGASSKYAL